MGFADFTVQAFHPLGQYKNWNDALLGKREQRLIDHGEIDFDYFAFAKALEAERQQEQAKQKGKIVKEATDKKFGFKTLTLSNGATVVIKNSNIMHLHKYMVWMVIWI